MDLSKRVEKLERAAGTAPMRLVHVKPGETQAKALAAHRRAHGPIPENAVVVFIRHSFASKI